MKSPRYCTLASLLLAMSLALPPGVAQTTTASAPAASASATNEEGGTIGLVRLEPVEVTGSRLRRLEVEGPSPVSIYDADFIRASGALNLADFLNLMPQNYTGVSAGRASAPNELNPEFGQRTETTTPAINFVTGASAAPPGQTGVSGVSLRGLGSGSTLVLVDGRRVAQSGAGNRGSDSRQGFVDLNTIPFGMIERIEMITDGASAIYGADAVAGVINIILKKNWVGSELTSSFKGAFDGGGRERSVSLTSGFAAGNLRGTVNVSYYDRASLKASQRSFSANQDHRDIVAGYNADGSPIFGRDLRLNWGYPAVAQTRSGGNFSNLTQPNGDPTRVAITPEGFATTPPLSAFTGAGPVPPNTFIFATGQRRGNTAEFLDIIPESERHSFAANYTYTFSDRLQHYGSYSYSDTYGLFNGQVAVSASSASTGFGNFATIVPNAFNPFDQDVIVGMIHYEFGSIGQKTAGNAKSFTAGLRGKLGETWEWDLGFNHQQQRFNQRNREFNGALISAPLANGTLNPFIDARVAGNVHASIYDSMAIYPTVFSTSGLQGWDLTLNGEVMDFIGGPILAAVGGSANRARNASTATTFTVAVSPVRTVNTVGGMRDSEAGFAEVMIPFVGKPNAMPGAQRLELTFAGRYENYDLAGSTTVPRVGLTWAPMQAILLRGSYAEGYRAPALTEYQVASQTFTSTVTDPRRTPANTTGVATTRGSNPDAKPETSTNEFYGLILEPPFVPGLSLQVNYYKTEQQNVIQVLSVNQMLLNEDLFTDRITRAAADANDIALSQPGRVTAIDQSFINFGRVGNESIDYNIDYVINTETFGRYRLRWTLANTIKSYRQLAPGQPALIDDGDTFAPPEWRHTASLIWSRGSINASMFFTYIDSFATNRGGNTLTATYPVDSAWKLDLRGGYEFQNGVWRGYGRGLRVQGGIGNVTNQKPPFSDTVFGYNGGLHSAWAIGRSYELSVVFPF
jgi:iron complex outermembrane recepter protein